ncbi:PREDICTED: 14-3-3 protein epsilon-like isoform X4 [Acropora digitifera]|nr:PREDICTED: 14-3-3 protein epsilon-like isoform X4 [Acropora digitifera]XP_029188766.1 14-3-3 protein epsilon isoform X2 [Acropora millepora]AET09749.1 hypothetical protein A049-F10 [Acropora millepora]
MDEIEDKGELLVIANLAEQAERYDDMLTVMKKIVIMSKELNTEERNMLSVAYKNVIGARRAAWRIFASLEQKHEDNPKEKELVVEYRDKVEKEIREISAGILELLDTYLIPFAETFDSKVFFHKMKGDYNRYLTEIMQGEDRKEPAKSALDAYKDAQEAAENLPSTNPISLGLALNFSVFYYEILDSPDEACRLAKKAFDSAVGDLDKSNESQYKESTLILQLLRDNLTLWTSEMQEEGVDEAA